MIGVEVVDPRGTRGPAGEYPAAPHTCRAIIGDCFANGLILEGGGRHGSVLRLLPPLVITDEELDQVASIVGSAVERATRKLLATSYPA